MDLKSGEIGPEADYDVEIVEGKVKLSVKYDGKGVDSQVAVIISADYFIDKLADRIPGKIDDAVLGMLKTAMKSA